MFPEVQPRNELQCLALSGQTGAGGDRTAVMKTPVLFHVGSRQVRRHVFPLRVPEPRVQNICSLLNNSQKGVALVCLPSPALRQMVSPPAHMAAP